MEYSIEMVSYGMKCTRILMKIGKGIQAILRLCLSNLRGYNICITDGRGFMKYAVGVGSVVMIYVLSCIKIGSGIRKLLRLHTHIDSKVIS
jgi:hypothetical protein